MDERFIEFVTNHWLLFIALGVVTFLLIQDFIESATQKFTSISPILAVTRMNDEDAIVLDVREKPDFVDGCIKEAINTPLGKLDDHIKNLTKYQNTPVIVVCQTGTRSMSACRKFTDAGFDKVYNLVGGMRAWEEGKLPVSKPAKPAKAAKLKKLKKDKQANA